MTLEATGLLLIILVMCVLFMTEKLPVDLTSFVGLMLLTLGGYLTAGEAFTGFSSPAVVTTIAMLCVGVAISETGIADRFALWIHLYVGNSDRKVILFMMLIAAFVSSFMNNVAATALLLPGVASLSRITRIPPSKLFMPLSFGVLLGGTTTLIGTSPNILASQILQDRGFEPFHFLDFTPFGLLLVILGSGTVALCANRLLPHVDVREKGVRETDLPNLYKLHERLFTLRIPEGSSLHGETLESTHFGEALGAAVVGVYRRGQTYLAPHAHDRLMSGDLLFVRGRLSDIEEASRFEGVTIETWTSVLEDTQGDIVGVAFRLRGSSLVGRTLRELNFRVDHGVAVVAIRRSGRLVSTYVSREAIKDGDTLLGLGSAATIENLRQDPDIEIVEAHVAPREILKDLLFVVRIPQKSALHGVSIRDSKIGELVGVTVVGTIRQGTVRLLVDSSQIIGEEDDILVAGEPNRAMTLAHLGELRVEAEAAALDLASEEVGIMEVVLSPRSDFVGKTLEQVKFREQYGFQVLALWRDGAPKRSRLSSLALQFGDALLLQGPRSKMGLVAEDRNFVVLSGGVRRGLRRKKAPVTVGALALVVFLTVFNIQPIEVSAFLGALVVLLAGAITMEEAYRGIEWRIVFLMGALLPIGTAVEKFGFSEFLSTHLVNSVGQFGYSGVLVALVLTSSLISQILDSPLAVILLGPTAISVAAALHQDPHGIMMAVALGASNAFLTPFSHRANLLIMSAGGYRSKDFFRLGLILTILSAIAVVILVPILYPA